jgi:hypothetical protein
VGGAQLPDLRFDALAVRRYPCIGMTHGMICPYILHLKTPFFSMGFSRCEFLDFRTYELQRGFVKTSRAGESQAITSTGIKAPRRTRLRYALNGRLAGKMSVRALDVI